MTFSDFIAQTSATAIDIGTFAILISIMVGIVTVWSAIRAARNEAKKAADMLDEIRSNSLEKLTRDTLEIKARFEILEVKYTERLKMIEKSLARLEGYNYRLREKENNGEIN